MTLLKHPYPHLLQGSSPFSPTLHISIPIFNKFMFLLCLTEHFARISVLVSAFSHWKLDKCNSLQLLHSLDMMLP